ncbi:MAG: hypothetical protein GWN00_12135 [Aliifodinibius sp.]|nr:hypothetical protein [Fodinibius sp.]NIV11884.1 hypothetical protein [Fodinibius sp.]NIY25529.1 hypothetical protein [Fodinibius sp.]
MATEAWTKDGGLNRIVLARTEPIAIVMAKSKLDILEKERRPDIRVNAINTI